MIPSKICVHHSATKDSQTFSTSAIKRYHMDVLGWSAIGYHALVELVDDDYFAIIGRPWDMDGAHTLGQNHLALGLCFVGNFDIWEPDLEMINCGVGVVKLWRSLYDIPVSAIHKHSEYADKTCPGSLFPWSEFLLKCR